MYYSLSVILDYPSLLYFWVLSPWVFLDSWLHLFPSFLAPFLIQCSKHARSSTLIIWSLFTKKYMCLALNFFSLWLTYWWGCDSHRPFFKLFQGLFSISKILSRVSSLSFLLIFFIHQHININFTISHFLGFTAHSYFYCVSFQSSFFKKKKNGLCPQTTEIWLLYPPLLWNRLYKDFQQPSTGSAPVETSIFFLTFTTLDVHWCFILIFCYFFISTFTLTFLVNCSLFHSSHPQWA